MGGKARGKGNRVKEPLVRLEHSHRRLEEQLDELAAHVSAIQKGRNTQPHWEGVGEIVAYLERAVARHELDEEETVFPRLARHPRLRPLLERLAGDHRSQRRMVSELAEIVESNPGEDSVPALVRVTKELAASYFDHIKREDRELLPAIGRHIPVEEQQVMALEMADRRG